jgi:hypothetical protein
MVVLSYFIFLFFTFQHPFFLRYFEHFILPLSVCLAKISFHFFTLINYFLHFTLTKNLKLFSTLYHISQFIFIFPLKTHILFVNMF